MDGAGPQHDAAPARRGLLARLLDWRDRKIADPAFQDWAAGFPLTRRIARRRAEDLFDLTAGFVYTQTLFACVEAEVFEHLAERPMTADELAPRIGLAPPAARRLMAAAASLGLVARRGGERFGLGQLGAAMRGAPGVAEMVRHHALLYRDLADPLALLRGDTEPELARYWGYVGGRRTHDLGPGETAPYTRLMAATQAMVSAEVLASYRFGRHRRLMDVGGGDGSFLRAVAARNPRLALTLFDLPAVADEARGRFADAGLAERAEVVGGDFFADPIPGGADAMSLVRVLYDHDDDAALRLLARLRPAIAPGGRLVVAEPMAETPGVPRVGDAYFSLYILAMTHGRPRTAAELAGLLREAGFARVRPVRTRRPFLTGLLIAEPG